MSTTRSVDRNYIKIKIYFLYNITNKTTLKTDFGNKIITYLEINLRIIKPLHKNNCMIPFK